MEKVYRKIGKRYVECGFNQIPDISDGIWVIKSNPGRKGQTSLFWKVGNIERPVDVVTHAALQSIEEDLGRYLIKLGDANSPEFQEAKELSGGYLTHPIEYYNISASDLCGLLLRRIALHLEDGEKLSWDSLQYKFREETQLHKKPEFNDGVKVLYQFTDWLKKNNIKFRQGKNIG